MDEALRPQVCRCPHILCLMARKPSALDQYSQIDLPAVLASLKAQNNALHVTTEKLVSTNSELMERVNKQSEQVAALQDALSRAQTAQSLGTGAPQPSPGVRSPFAKHLLECPASLQSAVPGTAAQTWYPYVVFGRMAASTLHSNTCSLYQGRAAI